MKAKLVTAPIIEPISLAELKLHLKIDSGSFADNIDETQLLPPGSHAHTATAVYTLIYELLTLDVAPGGAGWVAGDILTGQTSTKTCVIVEVLTTKTYTVKNRTGTFTLGEIISNGTATADQGVAYPTFARNKVSVLGYTAVVQVEAGTFTTGTADLKIQDSDDGITWTDWTGGAFTQITNANDNTIYEKAYTGTKQYISVPGCVLVAACPISISVIRLTATLIEDDDLNDAIKDGRETVENITRRGLLTQTWDYFLDDWPDGDFIKIPFGNLQNVPATQSVKWKDEDGTETTLTVTTDYLWEINGEQCGRIVLPYGGSWPTGTLYPSNPITIRFVCGWTTADLILKNIKRAVKFAAEDFYYHGNRHDVLEKVINNLLASYRLWDEF